MVSDSCTNPDPFQTKKQTQHSYYQGEDRLSSLEWELQQLKNRLASFSSYENIKKPCESTVKYIIKKVGSTIKCFDSDTGRSIKNDTDAWEVIQNAVDTVQSNGLGQAVVIRAGEYNITDTILIDTAIDLRGEFGFWQAGGTLIKLADNTNKDMFNINPPTINIPFISMANMVIDGNLANQTTGGNGIVLTANASDVNIRNIQVKHCFERGIDIKAGWYQSLESVWVEYCGYEGFFLGANSRLSNCVSALNGRSGVQIGTASTLVNCYISDNGRNGLWATSAYTYALLTNCRIRGSSYGAAGSYNNIQADNGYMLVSNSVLDGNSTADYNVALAAGMDGAYLSNNIMTGAVTGNINDASTGVFLNNNVGYETANAETPQKTYPIGAIVDFIDSGDGSGDGVYLLKKNGNWVKID